MCYCKGMYMYVLIEHLYTISMMFPSSLPPSLPPSLPSLFPSPPLGGSLAESDNLPALLTQVSATNETVREQIQQWKDRLQGVLTSVKKFKTDSDGFSQWIGEVQRRLNVTQEDGVRASVEGVQEQLEQLKVSLQHQQYWEANPVIWSQN